MRKLQAEEVGGAHDGNSICCAVEKAARDRPRLLRSPSRGSRGSEGEREQEEGQPTQIISNGFLNTPQQRSSHCMKEREIDREGEREKDKGREEEGQAGTARGRVVDVHTHIFFGDFDL